MKTGITKKAQHNPSTPNQDDLLAAFSEFLRLDVAQGDASPATIRTYKSQIHAFVDWCRGEGIHPALITDGELKHYRSHLIDASYARNTIAAKLNVVRRFYAMAQARGYRPDNPAEGLKPPKDLTARSERVKWHPVAAIQRILQAPNVATPMGRRDHAALVLMALHGLRVSEIRRLNVNDVDLEAGEAGTLSVLGKGQKLRTIYLVPESQSTLLSWLEIRPNVAQAEETALFVSLHHPAPGTRLSLRSIRRMVDGYLEALDLKRDGASCHSLRHSFATLSRAAGAKLDALARAMGHSKVTSTQIYADIVDAAAENPARFLVGALAGTE